MGRSRYKIYDNSYPHFLTASFVKWSPFFSYPDIAKICLESIDYLQKEESLKIYAWCFMENHLHLVGKSHDLSKSIARFKSFSAKEIIAFLKQRRNKTLLEDLSFAKSFHKHSQEFQVWQEGSHPEQINSRDMMMQKITYIHNNPVKRGYVDKAEEWRYSSARDYCGRAGLLGVCCEW